MPTGRLLALALTLLWAGAEFAALTAAEIIPPAPKHYFNDYAQLVPAATAQRLNAQLEQFEKDTSNQIVVAIFRRMESTSSVSDYTVRIAQAWGVGKKGRDNGAVLFVFVEDHQLYIQVGYGLEGVLPDAICKRIIEREIVPQFKQGRFDAGMEAGVQAILAATRGEYKGTGQTEKQKNQAPGWLPLFIFLVFFFIIIYSRWRQPWVYTGRRHYGGNSWGGWSGGGSGGGGGGGGGFSAGGGSFGGGGAGGRW